MHIWSELHILGLLGLFLLVLAGAWLISRLSWRLVGALIPVAVLGAIGWALIHDPSVWTRSRPNAHAPAHLDPPEQASNAHAPAHLTPPEQVDANAHARAHLGSPEQAAANVHARAHLTPHDQAVSNAQARAHFMSDVQEAVNSDDFQALSDRARRARLLNRLPSDVPQWIVDAVGRSGPAAMIAGAPWIVDPNADAFAHEPIVRLPSGDGIAFLASEAWSQSPAAIAALIRFTEHLDYVDPDQKLRVVIVDDHGQVLWRRID